MNTAYGILCDKDGLAFGSGRFWATPSSEVRSVQRPQIPVDHEHDGVAIGEVVFLERDRSGRLWAVAHVENHVGPYAVARVGSERVLARSDVYWSMSRRGGDIVGGFEILSVSVTGWPARVGALPLTFLGGALDHRDAPRRWRSKLAPHEYELLERACRARFERGRGDPIVVADLVPSSQQLTGVAMRSAAGALEFRSGASVDVSRPRRELDLLIAPAETQTLIHERRRSFFEVFSHGAFRDGADASRVRVNRDHVLERTVGKALSLDPWDEAGLIGTVRIARTELGDETLTLAEEGILDVSAGFTIPHGGEQWTRTERRRITRAVLHHIGLTPDPAYDGAGVLAVRSGAGD